MEAHQIKIPTTAHYYTIGIPSKEIKHIYFVLHGYGQLASQIIHKFDKVSPDTLIVAPEGLSRFYWNEKKGIVGASWMTKKDRLIEIEDYCRYLQQLYDTFIPQLHEDITINLLGFSQGGATAVRWLEQAKLPINHLILWGAGFPMDIDYVSNKGYWQQLKKYIVMGRQDEYLSADRLQKQKNFCKQNQLDYDYLWFDGKHEIPRTVLYPLITELKEK